ncbi:MAG TPA: hypothetical protein VG713_08735, partial [Pirellulales bacterium]|nr:hypothetical protein [Pirellulales bacterium]
MRHEELDNLRWLLGDDARAWLEKFADCAQPSPAAAAQLRRDLSTERARLVLEQVALRQRAKAKFADAAGMFFTLRGLEQATDDRTAAYKASRFSMPGPVVDLCCGIGGDMQALSRRATVLGIDRDRQVALRAAANCRQAMIAVADATSVAVEAAAAWHLDPDRRAAGRRTTQIA